MILQDFIDATGISISKLAQRTELTFHQIYHMLRGGMPTLMSAISIEKYTSGRVTAEELLTEALKKKQEGKTDQEQEQH